MRRCRPHQYWLTIKEMSILICRGAWSQLARMTVSRMYGLYTPEIDANMGMTRCNVSLYKYIFVHMEAKSSLCEVNPPSHQPEMVGCSGRYWHRRADHCLGSPDGKVDWQSPTKQPHPSQFIWRS